MYKRDIYLDIDDNLNNYIKSVELDSDSRVWHFHLTVDYQPLNLTGKTVMFMAEKPDKTNVLNDCEIIDAENGIVKVELTRQVNAVPGHVNCLLKIVGSDGYVLKTKTFIVEVSKTLSDKPIVSTNEFSALDEALGRVQNIDQRFAETNAQLSHITHQLKSNDDVGLAETLSVVKYGDSIYLNNFSVYNFSNEHIIPNGIKIYGNNSKVIINGKFKLCGDNIVDGIHFDGKMNTKGISCVGDNVEINNCKFNNIKHSTGMVNAINADNVNNIKIKNCIFDNLEYSIENGINGDSVGAVRAIRLNDCDYVDIKNNAFKNMRGKEDGDYIHISSNSEQSDVFPFNPLYFVEKNNIKISDNVFMQDSCKSSIKIQCGGVEVINNKFILNNTDSAYACIRVQGGTNNVVKNNIITSTSTRLPIVILSEYSSNVYIENNIFNIKKTTFLPTDTASIIQIQHCKDVFVLANKIKTQDMRDVFRINSCDTVKMKDNEITVDSIAVGVTLLKTLNTYSAINTNISFINNYYCCNNPIDKALLEIDCVSFLFFENNKLKNILMNPFILRNASEVNFCKNYIYLSVGYKSPFYLFDINNDCSKVSIEENYADKTITSLVRIKNAMTELSLIGNDVTLSADLFYNDTNGAMKDSEIKYVYKGKKYNKLDFGKWDPSIGVNFETGHEYFNTTSGVIFKWDGAKWIGNSFQEQLGNS